MSKSFTSVFFLFLLIIKSNQLFSQVTHFEYAFEPSLSTGISTMIADGAGNYYATSENTLAGTPGGGIRLIKFKSDGTILHSTELIFSDLSYANSIDFTSGGNILIAGYTEGCDVYYNAGKVLVVDASGAILWQKDYAVSTSVPVDNRIRHVIGLENGNIVASCDSTIIIFDSLGDSLTSFLTPNTINNLCKAGNSNFIIESSNSIAKYGSGGNFLHAYSSVGTPSGIHFIDVNRFVMFNGNAVQIADSLLHSIHQFSLSQLPFSIDYISVSNYDVLLSNHTSTGYALFDSTLTMIDSFSTGLNFLFFIPPVFSGDTIVSGGRDIGNKNYSMFKSFESNGQYLHTNTDLELVLVKFDTTYAFNPPALPSFVYDIVMVPRITVKNNGTDTIFHFNFNYESMMPGLCGPPSQIVEVNNILILPGQTIDIVTDTLYDGAFNLSVFPFVFPVCTWVSIPNNFQDKDHSNDYRCDTAYIYPINGINEITEGSFRLYPNPTTGAVQIIRSSGPIAKEYFIEDISGRIITSGKIENEAIDLSALTSGIYFIHFNDESFRYKVVKQ